MSERQRQARGNKRVNDKIIKKMTKQIKHNAHRAAKKAKKSK